MHLKVLLVGSILGASSAACSPPVNPMSSYANVVAARSSPPPNGSSPACQGVLEQLRNGYCSPVDWKKGSIRQSGPRAEADSQSLDSLVKSQREQLRSICSVTDIDAKYAEMDKCLAEHRAEGKVEQEAQAKRLPAERKNIASVKKDPKYPPSLERFRRSTDEVTRAQADYDDIKTREGLDCGRRQADCQRTSTLQGRIESAKRERSGAEDDLGRIASAHGIDPRDGEEIGLW
jgi:ribosomal protein L29